ncbi:hypothetical protein F0170_10840 [Pseudomonas sp. MAFF 730085]|uniref:Uncharacterized protein n=1 Tax=Pseudomonas kitaguniensis TaxID=2607908 RepID=A0A5N7JST9_9PSED|nr:hypothetical protein [Pseudomonas kitaguniensis]MPQ84440.1 hypothetical protein [Pseudomonas kitaguniensis]
MNVDAEINAEIFHDGKVIRTSRSTAVAGSNDYFQSRDLATHTSVSIAFIPPIKDGTTTYTFEETGPNFTCGLGGGLVPMPVAGTVVVVSTNSTDNLAYTFSGKFNDGRRDLEIKGTAKLNYIYS